MKEKQGLPVQQVNLAADVLVGLFPDRLGVHSDQLHAAAGALRAAAMVCEIAAILHEKAGREVLLKTACQKLYLPTAKQEAVGEFGTQKQVERLFNLVYIDLVDPINSRRDAWEPKLVASCEVDVVVEKARAALNRLNSLDPARNMDEILQDKELVRSLIEGKKEVDNGEYTIVQKDFIGGLVGKHHPPTMESDKQPDCCLTCANKDCIDAPAHQKRNPECSAVDGSWSCVMYIAQPECCTGCVNSYTDCVHSPEEDGECVGRETVSVSAEQQEDLTALDGESDRDGDMPAICGSCERDWSTCGEEPGEGVCEGARFFA